MRETVLARSPTLLVSAFLAITGLTLVVNRAIAQPAYPPCQPPQPAEYLLLVVTSTSANQQQVQRAVPFGSDVSVCNYLQDIVTRVGGFQNVEVANNWAQYVSNNLGLPAFVASPPRTDTAVPENSVAYNPQPLGTGYAVLVEYFNQTEVASQLQQLLGRQIGLVSYGQRPYLLAEFTTRQGTANRLLQTLSDRGFLVLVVDGRKALLLRSELSFP